MKKPVFGGFRPGPTQTSLYRLRSLKFWMFMKVRNCAIHEAKTKALISCAVTAQLICVFVFAYVKYWFSHDLAHIVIICFLEQLQEELLL